MQRSKRFLCYAWLMVVVAAGCSSLSRAEFEETVEKARHCTDGDVCIFISSDCNCMVPINKNAKDTVQDAIDSYRCEPLGEQCPYLENPRCENGFCVADKIE